jgi:hypothetical protein
MYQAGVKNITLYENKGLGWTYYDAFDKSKITNFTNSGQVVYVTNDQLPEMEFDIVTGRNALGVFAYTLSFYVLGLINESLSTINQLKESIYGWCPLVEYYDGTFKFYQSPFWFPNNSKIEIKKEMSFKCEMSNRVNSFYAHLNYTPGISLEYAYRADTTLLTADSTLITADYEL